jgi:subtilisin family serine protease
MPFFCLKFRARFLLKSIVYCSCIVVWIRLLFVVLFQSQDYYPLIPFHHIVVQSRVLGKFMVSLTLFAVTFFWVATVQVWANDGLAVQSDVSQNAPAAVFYLKMKQCFHPSRAHNKEKEICRMLENILHSKNYSVRSVLHTTTTSIVAVTVPVWTNVIKLCHALEQLPVIEYAEPMQRQQYHYAPRLATTQVLTDDPLVAQQYHWQRIQAAAAWQVSRGDSSVVVAVCDSGIDYEHEDLAANIWTNAGESGTDAQGRNKRTNGVDDDRNGKIDDWRGWDFVGKISEFELESGLFREDNDPKPRFTGEGQIQPFEPLNHGTHVTGTVAAVANNGKGGTGAAPRCRIMPLKCGSDGIRFGGIYRAYEAVLYAAQMGAKIIVCSFGGGKRSRFEQEIINTVTNMGTLVVAAAGNDGKLTDNVEFPASYDNVLAVGASDNADRAASFSDFGIKVSVFAPGEAILSAISVPFGSSQYSSELSGTSMAVPIVAGVAALVKSRFPTWTPRQITQQIRATSDNVFAANGMSAARPLGYFGRINAFRALTESPQGLTVSNINQGVLGSTNATANAITNFQPTRIALRVQNVLANADNVIVSMRSLDGKAAVVQQSQAIGGLRSQESRAADFTVYLEPSAFSNASNQTSFDTTITGTADFAIALQSGSYINYERISVAYTVAQPRQAMPVAVYSQEIASRNGNVSPNPASVEATLRLNVNAPCTAEVCAVSVHGALVLSERLQCSAPETLYRFDTSLWAQGVYTIVVRMPSGDVVRRQLVVLH